MRTIYSLVLAVLSVTVSGNAYENVLGLNIEGLTLYEDTIELDHVSAEVSPLSKRIDSDTKSRVYFDYVKLSDYKEVTSFFKGSVNGIYAFMEGEVISPYIMAGVGYEVINSDMNDKLDSRAFAQGRVGAIYHQGDNFDINIEGKVFQTFGNNREENEVMVTADVAIPVGTLLKGDIVQDECPIKIDGADEDRDGITDVVDQCPDTPCYFNVDAFGCPVKAILRIHFDLNKATIRPESISKIERFAAFLLANKGSSVKIIGHTDSDADDTYNMLLSEKRANAVMHQLIYLGVSINRLVAEGRGESLPIASNVTQTGKHLNRRIEVVLTYPQ